MARQRLRIWFARLAWVAAALVVVASIGITLSVQWFFASAPPLTEEPQRPEVAQHDGTGSRSESQAPHPLDRVLTLARDSLALHRQRDMDYTALLIKRQRSAGKLGDEVRMALKLRSRDMVDPSASRPIDVYLRYETPKSQAGREVIWRQGLNDDRMTVHESGLFNLARVEIAPTSRIAMLGNRYPITDIGIERLLIKLIEQGERDRSLGDCQVTIQDDVEVAGRRCTRIEVTHPEPEVRVGQETFRFTYFQAVIDMDREFELPIHYASYLWPDTPGEERLLDEEFTYENLQLNCSLTDSDFDPDNPAYQYPRR